MNLKKLILDEPLEVYNVDGTLNRKGTITHYTRILISLGGRSTWEKFYITNLGYQRIILGFPWFRRHNPDIDWSTGRVQWRIPSPVSSTKKNRLSDQTPMTKPTVEDLEKTEDQESSKEHIEDVLRRNLLTQFINWVSPNDQYLFDPTSEDLLPDWIKSRVTSSTETEPQSEDETKQEIPLEERIPKEYHKWIKLFDKKAADRFPISRPWDHKIDLKPGFKPTKGKTYHLTQEEDLELQKFIKEQLEKGYIRPSESEQTASFFFVGKKDGKLRPVQDYRNLNEWTVKNNYPLPLISDLLDKLREAKYFTKFDIRWGYNNVRIRKGDEWKAAFNTNRGTYEPTVMFFGMCNSPATFQTMMNDIFEKLISQKKIIVYMDDILIFAKTREELEEITKEVLQTLEDNDLYLKPEKCQFEQTKIDYLGMIVKEGEISMDPAKLKGIQDWPIPKTVKQVRSFLGFGNFYRKFIRNYSDIAKPMNDLLKKNQPFIWSRQAQKAFDTLKKRFTEEPVLAMPDIS